MVSKEELEQGLVTEKDLDGNEVTVFVKKPTTKEYRESQAEYNRAFRAALESGAVLKKKLTIETLDISARNISTDWAKSPDYERKELVKRLNMGVD